MLRFANTWSAFMAQAFSHQVGFPVAVGSSILYMHRGHLHTDQSYIDALGWVRTCMRMGAHVCFASNVRHSSRKFPSSLIRFALQSYCAFDARAFYYGFFTILRLSSFCFCGFSSHPNDQIMQNHAVAWLHCFSWRWTVVSCDCWCRRTLFVLISRVTTTGLQSLMAVILVTLFCAFHMKVRPYKMDLLDRLDLVRAFGSQAFLHKVSELP